MLDRFPRLAQESGILQLLLQRSSSWCPATGCLDFKVPQELHNAAPLMILPNEPVLKEVTNLYTAMVQAVPAPMGFGREPVLDENPVVTALEWLTPVPTTAPCAAVNSTSSMYTNTSIKQRSTSSGAAAASDALNKSSSSRKITDQPGAEGSQLGQ